MAAKTRLSKILFFSLIFVLFFSALSVSYLRVLDHYELGILDMRFRLRPTQPVLDKLALIEIGDDTIEEFGRFPFDRSYHAILIKALSEAGAKAVVFDFFFSETQPDDEEMLYAMRDAKNVYIPYVLQLDTAKPGKLYSASGYVAKNIRDFELLAAGSGHINIIPDRDGKFRRIPLCVQNEDKLSPFLSFLVACDSLNLTQNDIEVSPGKFLKCGPRLRVPLDERSNMIVNYSGKWGTAYKHYSYRDIVQSYLAGMTGQQPILDLSVFRDKICVVGLTATGTVDLHPNPFENLYPAVGIHIEVLNSFLTGKFVRRASKQINLLIFLILITISAAVSFKARPVKGLGIILTTAALFFVTAMLLFMFFGLWLDVFAPVCVMGFVYLAVTFYKYVREWKERIVLDNELGIARRIQLSFLPKKLPAAKGLDVAVSMFTARSVGGDLYDFIEFESGTVGVLIGDVSGKGIPAALFMALASEKFKFFAPLDLEPDKVLRDLNTNIVKTSSSGLFVTVFYMLFDTKNNVLSFSSGGHLPAVYLSEGKAPIFINTNVGMPLGIINGPYECKKMPFKKGDIFVLYTDGVSEAMNPKAEMYGKERLASVVAAGRHLTAKDLLDTVARDVRKFEAKAEQHDDMTLIAIKIS